MARVANVQWTTIASSCIFHTLFFSFSLSLSSSCNRSSGRLLHMDCENMEMLEKRVSAGDPLHSRRIKMINYTSVRGEIEKKKLL